MEVFVFAGFVAGMEPLLDHPFQASLMTQIW